MSRISIPKPSFLDDCIAIGEVNGEKRWRSEDGDRLRTSIITQSSETTVSDLQNKAL